MSYLVDVPESKLGDWRVERFVVSEEDAKWANMRAAFSPGGHLMRIDPGRYTRLMRGRTVVMSDTPAEVRAHREMIRRATGDVLIHGLGLGMVAAAVARKPEVRSLTVVELADEVLALVGPWLREVTGENDVTLNLVRDDALTWRPTPGTRWDVAWHDIWDTICEDNLPEMHVLHRRFGRRVAWQGSWSRDLLEAFR